LLGWSSIYIFFPEDGGDTFIGNAVNFLQDYMASQPRRPQLIWKNKYAFSVSITLAFYWQICMSFRPDLGRITFESFE
jgi:hypothetical protein